MEKLTNNRDEFLNQIKVELLGYESEGDWKEIFTYAEIPFFLRYAFSYNWSINIKTSKYRLKRKEWNAEYDHLRFNKGIYNLDRLAIKEKELLIDMEAENYLHSINWGNINTIEFKGIVLDGLMCELRIHKIEKSFNWNIDEEMNEDLTKLISVIRNWKREIKEYFR